MSSAVPDDRARYERAHRRVREIRGFSLHVAVFVLINIVLHVFYFVLAPTMYWAFWPILGLIIGLLAQGLATYRWMPFIGKEWQERKIRELMETDQHER